MGFLGFLIVSPIFQTSEISNPEMLRGTKKVTKEYIGSEVVVHIFNPTMGEA
jgi:hypothetical protein